MLVRLVRAALGETGLDLVGAASVAAYDARAPAGRRARELFAPARGLLVVGSAGRGLWARVRAAAGKGEHRVDDYVESALGLADAALAKEGVGFRRLLPTFAFTPRADFVALGEIANLGRMGPFGLLIHPEHGPWWALRGAYLVDREVEPTPAMAHPCAGCAAPCVGGPGRTLSIAEATPEVRTRCVVGPASRYDDEQIAYHYGRAVADVRLSGER